MMMHDECHNCTRKDQEILGLKAALIREQDARTLDKVRTALLEAARKGGVLPTASAEEDAVARALALGTWKIDKKGNIVLTEGGMDVISRRDDSAVTPTIAFRDMRPDAPHLYGDVEETKTSDGPNPWSKNSWNMTQQGQIVLSNPAKAKTLAAAAGVTLNL
jgi:hypothetical protein